MAHGETERGQRFHHVRHVLHLETEVLQAFSVFLEPRMERMLGAEGLHELQVNAAARVEMREADRPVGQTGPGIRPVYGTTVRTTISVNG